MANLKPMYRGVVGDRTTELMTSFDAAVDTKMTVFDSSIFPSAPNYVTVRMANKSCLATYKYTGISGNQITGLEFIESDIPLGQTAQYPIGSFVYWSLTHKLLDDIEYNIEEIGAAAGVQHASKTVYGVVKIGDGIDVDDGVISVTGGGAGGNYNNLTNKPKINSIELVGNKTALDLGLASKVSLEAEIVDRATQDTAITTALNTHIADKNNPHAVSKEQLGLGNVNNTSDMNKPVSSAQQTALNGKVDKNQGTSHAGDYLRVNDAGMVYAQGLPVASETQSGTVKVGKGLEMDSNGKLNNKVVAKVTGTTLVFDDGTATVAGTSLVI